MLNGTATENSHMAFPRTYPVLFEIISALAVRGHRPVRLSSHKNHQTWPRQLPGHCDSTKAQSITVIRLAKRTDPRNNPPVAAR
jgi:hypothetical protein